VAREVIIVTGCSGRIGFKTCERFSPEFDIVGLDIILGGHLPNVEFMIVDLASDESVKEGMERVQAKYGNKIASVIHLAAYYSFSEAHSPLYDQITVKGTERLLKNLQSFEVGQFIFSSTMLVHAPSKPGQKITENSPVVPKWAYPESKVKTEKLIHELKGNIPTVILRIAGVYDDYCHSIPISNQIQRIYENQLESHFFAGDLSHGASFLHMDDLIEAIWLTVKKRTELPQELVLLLGEEKTLSYNDLQNEISHLLFGKNWKTWSLPKPLAKFGAYMQDHLPFVPKSFIKPWMIDLADDHYELDISKAKSLLGWSPKHNIKDSLAKMIAELKVDPIAWYDENKLKHPHSFSNNKKAA